MAYINYQITTKLTFFEDLVRCWGAQLIINKEVQARYRRLKVKPPIAIHMGDSGREYKFDGVEWDVWDEKP